MRQWQCPCGVWVDMTRLKHVHAVIDPRQNSLEEMHRLRLLGQDSLALEQPGEIIETPWKPEYPRRDKPDDQTD